jgi:hypothetical protein
MRPEPKKNHPVDQILRDVDAQINFPFDPDQWQKLANKLDKNPPATQAPDAAPAAGSAWIPGWSLLSTGIIITLVVFLFSLGQKQVSSSPVHDSLQINHHTGQYTKNQNPKAESPETAGGQREKSAGALPTKSYPRPTAPIETPSSTDFYQSKQTLDTADSAVIPAQEKEESLIQTRDTSEIQEEVPRSKKKRHIIW